MSNWLDDEDDNRRDKLRRDGILKAKAFLFWDNVFKAVSQDAQAMKKRYGFDISVHDSQPEEIVIQKDSPYPTFTVSTFLDIQSESIRVEWTRMDGRDQKSYKKPLPERWYLSLDVKDNFHVKLNEEEITAEQASRQILSPLLNY